VWSFDCSHIYTSVNVDLFPLITDSCLTPIIDERMFYSIHVIPKLNSENDPIVQSIVNTIELTAIRMGIQVVDRDQILGHTLIIAVGGDGTMLQAMRYSALYDATAFGVNLGKVGFLSDLNIKELKRGELDTVICDILAHELATFIEERTVLITSLDGNTIACNEVSVSPLYSDTMLTYHLRVGTVSAGIHRANSILVATASGSTAYSLSAGGALMMPELDAIQIVPVAPITMTSRPLVVSANSVVDLELTGEGLAVRADGQIINRTNHTFTKATPYRVSVRRYLRKAKVLHLADWNYFDSLTQKLGWIKQ
jgi:NAD+ kinase